MKKLIDFINDEEGVSMAEYAVLIAVISISLVALISPFRKAIIGVFTGTTSAINQN